MGWYRSQLYVQSGSSPMDKTIYAVNASDVDGQTIRAIGMDGQIKQFSVSTFNVPVIIPSDTQRYLYRNTATFIDMPNYNSEIKLPGISYNNLNELINNCPNYNYPINISNVNFINQYIIKNCVNFNQPITVNNSVSVNAICYNCNAFNSDIHIENSGVINASNFMLDSQSILPNFKNYSKTIYVNNSDIVYIGVSTNKGGWTGKNNYNGNIYIDNCNKATMNYSYNYAIPFNNIVITNTYNVGFDFYFNNYTYDEYINSMYFNNVKDLLIAFYRHQNNSHNRYFNCIDICNVNNAYLNFGINRNSNTLYYINNLNIADSNINILLSNELLNYQMDGTRINSINIVNTRAANLSYIYSNSIYHMPNMYFDNVHNISAIKQIASIQLDSNSTRYFMNIDFKNPREDSDFIYCNYLKCSGNNFSLNLGETASTSNSKIFGDIRASFNNLRLNIDLNLNNVNCAIINGNCVVDSSSYSNSFINNIDVYVSGKINSRYPLFNLPMSSTNNYLFYTNFYCNHRFNFYVNDFFDACIINIGADCNLLRNGYYNIYFNTDDTITIKNILNTIYNGAHTVYLKSNLERTPVAMNVSDILPNTNHYYWNIMCDDIIYNLLNAEKEKVGTFINGISITNWTETTTGYRNAYYNIGIDRI